jgi:hypothetical protein
MKPGLFFRFQCLHNHKMELSTQCKASLDVLDARANEAKKGAVELETACGDDQRQFCKGQPNLIKCMDENVDKFSSNCQAVWKKMRK